MGRSYTFLAGTSGHGYLQLTTKHIRYPFHQGHDNPPGSNGPFHDLTTTERASEFGLHDEG